MQIPNLLNSWPATNMAERLYLSSSESAKPYRVWVLGGEGQSPKLVGIMAKSLKELKEKTVKCLESQKNVSELIDIETVSILAIDSDTYIVDDEYFKQVPNTEDFVLLLPGQSWQAASLTQKGSNKMENLEQSSLIQRKPTSQSFAKSDFRYFVPTPEGEMARLTVDVYRQQPADSGCIRLTVATAGETGMAVSYEVKLNGIRAVVHHTLRWTAVLVTNVGHFLVHTGELLKKHLI